MSLGKWYLVVAGIATYLKPWHFGVLALVLALLGLVLLGVV